MNKIQKLIVSMRVVLHLWKMGFYFSDNSHKDKSGSGLGTYWGFHRLNFDDGTNEEFAILDIDFAENIPDVKKNKYFHMHAAETIFRVDYEHDCQVKMQLSYNKKPW